MSATFRCKFSTAIAIVALAGSMGGCRGKLKSENQTLRDQTVGLKGKLTSIEGEKAALATTLQQTEAEKNRLARELAARGKEDAQRPPAVLPQSTDISAAKKDDRRADDPKRIADAVTRCVELLLAKQEDMENPKAEPDARAEWPYEGVVRVQGLIPIGYRIGGTAIACTALLRAPGYLEDPKRQAAIARAVKFICDSTKHPLMSVDDWDGGYDVRGWGYSYALGFFLELKNAKAVPAEPKETAERVESAIKWAIDALNRTEIKGVGGWNYAHTPGRDSACPSSPFMTGPTLQYLFEAKRQGYAVDEGVITRALDALERCRGSTGSFAYAAEKPMNPASPEAIPGAVGRMLVGEVTLYLAGRSDQARLRGALDAFLAHWDALDARRAKPGTHEGPYHIAPYYFYYAHFYAAQAIELLPAGIRSANANGRGSVPDSERKDYRRRLAELLFSVQMEDGSWNDRVFQRTSNYGTAMVAMSFLMPTTPAPARLNSPATPVTAITPPPQAK